MPRRPASPSERMFTMIPRHPSLVAASITAIALLGCDKSDPTAPSGTADAAVIPSLQTSVSHAASNTASSSAASSGPTPLPDAAPMATEDVEVRPDAEVPPADATVVPLADAGERDGAAPGDAASALDATPEEAGLYADGAVNECSPALPLRCGDRLEHDTRVQGRPNVWSGYNASARLESGAETVYALKTSTACQVETQLYNLTVDLDLFLLTSCGWLANSLASSTPLDLQTVETMSFATQAEQTYFVIVDGYDGDEGSYTLQVDCTCD
jgi:hypothetical protein